MTMIYIIYLYKAFQLITCNEHIVGADEVALVVPEELKWNAVKFALTESAVAFTLYVGLQHAVLVFTSPDSSRYALHKLLHA